MTFEEILDQAIAMLQRRGRVTYRLLKRQFQLDDDTLADLLAELHYAYQGVIREDEQGIVWTGTAALLSTPLSPALPPFQPSVSQEAPAPQADGTPTTPSMPDAERRQLTVMFCDLVDSTKLSGQLDPEEYRDVVRQHHRVCTEVIQRYDGYIAQYLGDGLLVYFGWPQAHEDDAQRTVRTGLGILASMGDLNTELTRGKGIQLAVRVGIHTGLVVVGAMGDQGRHGPLALGETPNIAARIQGLAAPNTIAISDATYRLVQGYCQCRDLGTQALRGVAESMHIYHVLGESGATSRLEVTQPRGLTPLVGRESEVTLLLERWQQAKAGQGQVVLLSGEGGIGKSRLVQVLKEHVAQEPHVRWECRSVPYYQHTALYPLMDLFQRTLQLQPDETSDEKLAKLEHTLGQYRLPLEATVPLFTPLLALPFPEDRYAPLALSPPRQRQKTLETIVAILLELAERQSVLFILEDLHWTDPTTLELLNFVIDQTPTASLLVLLTCRPHFQPAWHHRSYITEMTLNHLSHTQVEQIVAGVTEGKSLPPEVLQQIREKTDGVPLFVEEMTKAILESGHLKETDGHYALTGSFSTFAIPATLQDSLMARLDRLVTAKAVAQYAAVIGRQFFFDLLQAVSQLDASTLQRELERLVEAEIVYQRGLPPQAYYFFKHVLIRDAAYESLLKSTRQQYHQRIAQVLEAQFPETAEAQPELLAHHYTEAGLAAQALDAWQRAGQRAAERSAHAEAVSHLTKGLEVLATLPDTHARAHDELQFHCVLGTSLIATHGFAAAAVEQTYIRARELCQQLQDTQQLFQVLVGLWGFYDVRDRLLEARDMGEQLLALAHRQHDPALLVPAHRMLGETFLWLGEFGEARAHLEQGIALYDPQQHRAHGLRYGHDAGTSCLGFLSRVLWILGSPDQALQRSREALALAQELGHPFSLAFTLQLTIGLHQVRGEAHEVLVGTQRLLTLATEYGFAQQVAVGTRARGWALTVQGHMAEGIALMRQGHAAYRATGAERAYPLAWLAEALGKAGEADEGLHILAEGLALVEQHEERVYEAELHRLKGELLLSQASPTEEVEACFRQALNIARRQQTRSLELRAAMSLARLWQQQGKRAEAHELLSPVYGWFTEGFDTADLQEAKALLEALA